MNRTVQMTEQEIKAEIYDTLKTLAEQINEVNPTYGKYALRKVAALSLDSEMDAFYQVSYDMKGLANKVS